MAILKIKDDNGNIINIPAIKGDKGDAGVTPHIGGNGNWFIGDADTGVLANAIVGGITGTYRPRMLNNCGTQHNEGIDVANYGYGTGGYTDKTIGVYTVVGNLLLISICIALEQVQGHAIATSHNFKLGIELPTTQESGLDNAGLTYAPIDTTFVVSQHTGSFVNAVSAIKQSGSSFICLKDEANENILIKDAAANETITSYVCVSGWIPLVRV